MVSMGRSVTVSELTGSGRLCTLAAYSPGPLTCIGRPPPHVSALCGPASTGTRAHTFQPYDKGRLCRQPRPWQGEKISTPERRLRGAVLSLSALPSVTWYVLAPAPSHWCLYPTAYVLLLSSGFIWIFREKYNSLYRLLLGWPLAGPFWGLLGPLWGRSGWAGVFGRRSWSRSGLCAAHSAPRPPDALSASGAVVALVLFDDGPEVCAHSERRDNLARVVAQGTPGRGGPRVLVLDSAFPHAEVCGAVRFPRFRPCQIVAAGFAVSCCFRSWH